MDWLGRDERIEASVERANTFAMLQNDLFDEGTLVDMLTDLLHWSDSRGGLVSFNRALRSARFIHRSEAGGG